MAKNRKKRRQEVEGADKAPAVTTTTKPKAEVVKPPVVAPAPKRGPTPKKVKVKRPKYQRPPRSPAQPKPEPKEEEEKKGLTYSARTLRHSVARTIPKTGPEAPDRPGWSAK